MNSLIKILFLLGAMVAVNPAVHAKTKKKYICEKVTKSGKHKTLKKVTSKKKCEKLGGEWLKADHDHGDHGHGHSH